MADGRDIERRLQDLEAQVAELRRALGNLPVRYGAGGEAGNALPNGTGKGKVLILIDDLDPGTWGVDYPFFADPQTPRPPDDEEA